MRQTLVQLTDELVTMPSITVRWWSGKARHRCTIDAGARCWRARGVVTSTAPLRSNPGMPNNAAAERWEAAAAGPAAKVRARSRCSYVGGDPQTRYTPSATASHRWTAKACLIAPGVISAARACS